MKTTLTFRSKVFKRAHEIRKSTGKNFAVCLAKAWNVYRLAKRMAKEAVDFAFEKKDGTLKRVTGTLKSIENKIKGTGTTNYKVLAYWDTEAERFGSFKVENLISIF